MARMIHPSHINNFEHLFNVIALRKGSKSAACAFIGASEHLPRRMAQGHLSANHGRKIIEAFNKVRGNG